MSSECSLPRKTQTRQINLPTELFTEIAQYLTLENNFLGYRTICKQARDGIDRALDIFWMRLRDNPVESDIDIKLLIRRVENNPENANLKTVVLFKKLVKQFQNHYGLMITSHNAPLFLSQFPSIQASLDASLERVWRSVYPQRIFAIGGDLALFNSTINADNSVNLPNVRACFKSTEKLAILQKVDTVDLTGKRLLTICPELGKLTGLKNLNLSNATLFGVGLLGTLTNLETLSLKDNRLFDPPELEGLDKLIQLNLQENLLKIPPRLDGKKKLEILRLNDNELKTGPDVTGLNSLKTLHLHNNSELNDVPGLKTLPNISILNLTIKNTLLEGDLELAGIAEDIEPMYL